MKPSSKRKPAPSSPSKSNDKKFCKSDGIDTDASDLASSENEEGSKKKKTSTKITEEDLKATRLAGIIELAKEGKQEELLNSVAVSVFPREDDVNIIDHLRRHLVGLPSATLTESNRRRGLLTTLNMLIKAKDTKMIHKFCVFVSSTLVFF